MMENVIVKSLNLLKTRPEGGFFCRNLRFLRCEFPIELDNSSPSDKLGFLMMYIFGLED